MKRRYVSRTNEEWKQIVAEWAQSGETQSAYCDRRGIGRSSFMQWRRRLAADEPGRRQVSKRKSPEFIPMGPVALAAMTPAAVVRWPDGTKMELSHVPEPEWMLKVLRS